jgi:peptide/nickel transport system substrate-binding protein
MRVDFVRAEPYIKNPDALINVVNWGPSTFEPTWAWDFHSIEDMASCYDRLIDYDRENVGSYRPSLAEEVPTIENGGISPDGLTYRFHIRSGVSFVNGLPLTPEDVEYSFERAIVRDPEWGPVFLLIDPLLGVLSTRDGNGGFTVIFEDIDNAVVVEGEDLVFHLAKPYAPFMALLASWFSSIVSKQWCIANGDWPGTAETWEAYNNAPSSPLDGETMGTGPFKLESWTSGEVDLGRNDLYWRGPAKLEHVIFKVVDDAYAAVQMLIDGDADISYVSRQFYSLLEGVEGIRDFRNLPTMVVYLYYFNYAIPEYSPLIGSGQLDGNGIPPDFFSDIDIRKAFAYSIDYEGIINDLYLGEANQPASIIVEGVQFHNPDQPKYTFDLAKAQEHFEQAWEGQVWETGFSFALPYWQGSWTAYTLAEIVKDNIECLNPNFHMELVPVSFYMLFSRQLPFYYAGWGADFYDPDSIVRPMLHSEVPYGDAYLTGYSDPYVDYLIDAGVETIDNAERQAIYYELQSIYHEDAVSIPLAQPLNRHYERDWVQGWYHNPMAPTDFYSLWKEDNNLVNMLISYVEDLVNNEVLNQGEGNSLIKKLESAIHLIDKGNLQGASQKVNDFIDQVEALIVSERLPMEIGQELIALAQEIIESLGVI